MTNRELLELAARAAGYTVDYNKVSGRFSIQHIPGIVRDVWRRWDPIGDDGDALRLAVKLDIHISLYGPDTGMNTWVIDGDAETFDSDYGEDPCAAVRLLIVRAAAFIGAKLP